MIDIGIYKKMHPNSSNYKTLNRDDLGLEAMASDIPPGGVFTLLLPSQLIGFNMQEKKWGKCHSDSTLTLCTCSC
jgi:hypothetical protein